MGTSRNKTLDVARGFTVFIMPAVHYVLYYGNEKTRRSWLGKLLGFLAEGPGAQLFMFLMGVSVTLGRKKKAPQILKRAALLLAQGFLLNVLRLIIPYKISLIPEQLLQDVGVIRDKKKIKQLLLTGDILQCASISYLIAALIYRQRNYAGRSLILAVTVIFFSPKIWNRRSRHPLLSYFLKLCMGQPPEAFFPVLPWLAYTMAGVAWGHYLKTIAEKRLYMETALTGITLMALGKYMQTREPEAWKTNFYRLGPGGTFAHLGIVLLWMCLCQAAVRHVKWNRFFRLLIWLSKHITKIYFVQWIIVLWLLPLFGYRRSGVFKSLVSMLINTVLTFKAAKLKNPLLWKTFTISQALA